MSTNLIILARNMPPCEENLLFTRKDIKATYSKFIKNISKQSSVNNVNVMCGPDTVNNYTNIFPEDSVYIAPDLAAGKSFHYAASKYEDFFFICSNFITEKIFLKKMKGDCSSALTTVFTNKKNKMGVDTTGPYITQLGYKLPKKLVGVGYISPNGAKIIRDTDTQILEKMKYWEIIHLIVNKGEHVKDINHPNRVHFIEYPKDLYRFTRS